jgi:PhnB protein
MQLNPYLNFNGQCETAFKFFEQILGGRITFMMIMHATLAVTGAVLMGADVPPDRYPQPKGINVSLHVKHTAEGERIFSALAENGTVQMPFQETFWSKGFGMCVDRF